MRSLLRRPQGQVPEAAVDRPAEDLAQGLSAPDFDLAATLASGQVFRWATVRPELVPAKELGGSATSCGGEGRTTLWTGWIGTDSVQVSQQGSRLNFQGTSVPAIKRFFSLDRDVSAIARDIDVDPIIHAALQTHWGVHLIRQEPWECLAGFILSSFNNIVRLTGMLNRLALRFGKLATGPAAGRPCGAPPPGVDPPLRGIPAPPVAWQFPQPEALARVSERVLRNCGLGFRAPYLKAAAQMVAQGTADLEKWRALEDEALRRRLLTIPGVGEKVVECVMLFAFGREAAFPVDVWIGRAMREWYFKRRKVTDRQIREFALKHFGAHCGWAQQYLYCHARSL